jgi:hypothetical protein
MIPNLRKDLVSSDRSRRFHALRVFHVANSEAQRFYKKLIVRDIARDAALHAVALAFISYAGMRIIYHAKPDPLVWLLLLLLLGLGRFTFRLVRFYRILNSKPDPKIAGHVDYW